MKYKYLLFDADDTLLDFKRSERQALTETLTKFGIAPTDDLISGYSRINDSLWKLLECGGIEKTALRVRRFELFADEYSLARDPRQMADEYANRLSEQSCVIEGAEDICRELSAHFRMFVITNGIKNIQTKRMSASPLCKYIERSFISEDVGYEKPSAAFFDYVEQAIPGFDRSAALVIGDSLTSDIAGGIGAGIDTCWYDPAYKPIPNNISPTYVIHELSELYDILCVHRARDNGSVYDDAETEKQSMLSTAGVAGYAAALSALGIEMRREEPLAVHSSFKIGGAADICVFPKTDSELCAAIRTATKFGMRKMVLGNGSNVLFDDEGFRGAIIFTKMLRAKSIGGNILNASAGVTLSSVAVEARNAGLGGLEFAYGIPGSVGGAVCMNAGAYGNEMSDIIDSVTLYDSAEDDIVTLSAAEMLFGYRKSIVGNGERYTVISARFKLVPCEQSKIFEKMSDYMSRRVEKQPLEYPSAGSVFKRSAPTIYTGKLIEDSGLKGYTIGGAQISQKHAGFIINIGGATSADVNALIEHIQQVILKNYGIELQCEIRRIPVSL